MYWAGTIVRNDSAFTVNRKFSVKYASILGTFFFFFFNLVCWIWKFTVKLLELKCYVAPSGHDKHSRQFLLESSYTGKRGKFFKLRCSNFPFISLQFLSDKVGFFITRWYGGIIYTD